MFRAVSLSIIRSLVLYTQQWYTSYRLLAGGIRMELQFSITCMTFTIAVCTVLDSWWWTEKLPETRTDLFQK